MKLKRLAIGSLLIAMCLPAFASDVKVTIKSSGQTVSAVLEEIRKETGYEFFYNDDSLDTSKRISVNIKNEDLSEALAKILTGTDIAYTIRDNQVVLSKKKNVGNTAASSRVRGTVTDANGEPIIGATVREVGTRNAVTTDIDGKFDLKASVAEPEVEISYLGMKPFKSKMKSGVDFKAVLSEDSKYLDEVVVIGYGSITKRDLTGSVSQVKVPQSTAGTVNSLSNALAGKAAGLQVSANNAQPGAGTSFLIRGAGSPNTDNSPLIVIDGFPVNPTSDGATEIGYYKNGTSDNFLGSLNPNDVESVEILKDASATAIYGARAGHGVILITTKKGKEGQAKVSYSGSVSVQNIAKNYDMLDTPGVMRYSENINRERWLYENKIGVFGGLSEADAAKPYVPLYSAAEIAAGGPTTDWVGAVTRTGMQTQHNLSVSGGTASTRYLVSGNYFLQDGVVKGNDFARFTLRSNIEQKFNKHFSGGLNLTFSRIDKNSIPSGSGSAENAPLIALAVNSNPMQPIYDENGNYTKNPNAAFLPNPVSMLDITNKERRERFLGSVYLEYKPIDEITVKGTLGIDRNYHKRKVYLPTTTLYGEKVNGRADIAQYDQNDYLVELTAAFNKTFAVDHRLNAVIGFSYQSFKKENVQAGNSDFLTDHMIYNNLYMGQYAKPTVKSGFNSDEMESFFGRVNYSYKGRYLATFTMRADASSNFAPGHQWGYFPSVGLAWRFSDEEFIAKNNSWLSNGKLRLSWGKTGNSNIGNRIYNLYTSKYRYNFGGQSHLGFVLSQLGNPDITWETTTEYNVGVDLGFFNSRINLSVDYFDREISNLLNWRPLQSIHEVTSIADNIGKTHSTGMEITLNTVNITNRDFNWTSDLTFSFYRDRWKERSEGWNPTAYQEYKGYLRPCEGYYLSNGLVKPGETISHMPNAVPGQVKIKDINGFDYNDDGTYKVDEHGVPILTGKPDGKIDDADKVRIGSWDPGFILGFNNSITYKNFDFNIYFYGNFNQWKGRTYRDIEGSYLIDLLNGSNLPTSVSEVWSSENPGGWRPGLTQRYSSWSAGSTDFYLKKCWFLRCRNITLGYRIPVGKALSNLRVYADVTNPFVITNYKGLDPETDDVEYSVPNVRSYSFGVELTF